MDLQVAVVNEDQYQQINNFISTIFDKHVAPHYSEEGREEFYKVITPEHLQSTCDNGAMLNKFYFKNELVGVTQVKENHIILFFVSDQHQGLGIGALMMNWVKKSIQQSNNAGVITVNSAPNSLGFYNKLGFRADDILQEKNGIKYTPMRFEF